MAGPWGRGTCAYTEYTAAEVGVRVRGRGRTFVQDKPIYPYL